MVVGLKELEGLFKEAGKKGSYPLIENIPVDGRAAVVVWSEGGWPVSGRPMETRIQFYPNFVPADGRTPGTGTQALIFEKFGGEEFVRVRHTYLPEGLLEKLLGELRAVRKNYSGSDAMESVRDAVQVKILFKDGQGELSQGISGDTLSLSKNKRLWQLLELIGGLMASETAAFKPWPKGAGKINYVKGRGRGHGEKLEVIKEKMRKKNFLAEEIGAALAKAKRENRLDELTKIIKKFNEK